MPGELVMFDFAWTRTDAEHVGNLAPTVLSIAARPSLVVGMAQCGNGHSGDAVVGLFVGHPHLIIGGQTHRSTAMPTRPVVRLIRGVNHARYLNTAKDTRSIVQHPIPAISHANTA